MKTALNPSPSHNDIHSIHPDKLQRPPGDPVVYSALEHEIRVAFGTNSATRLPSRPAVALGSPQVVAPPKDSSLQAMFAYEVGDKLYLKGIVTQSTPGADPIAGNVWYVIERGYNGDGIVDPSRGERPIPGEF